MLLNRLREYIEPINLEMHIYTNGIYIINYTLISNFTDKKIIIEGKKEKITIMGNNLVIKKLEKYELFISGMIDSINLR